MKRKVFLINPGFQLRFIGWMAGVAFSVIAIIYCANMYFIRYYIQKGKEAGLPDKHVFFQFLSDQYHYLNWVLFITSLIIGLVIFLIGLLLSHRIAGPLHQFNQKMQSTLQDGILREVHFRKGDFFRELQDSYNQVILKLRKNNKQ